MKKWTLVFFILFFKTSTKAQHTTFSAGYIPPEFLSPAKVNEYYSDSANTLYYENIKLRNDCRFINEYCYTRYGGTVITAYMGKYYISNDTLFFEYEKIQEPHDTMILKFPAVPFTWDEPPEFLVIKKGGIFKPLKYKKKKKGNYTLRGKLEFELGQCK